MFWVMIIRMAKEYIISPVSSLNFDHGWKLGIQREADYIQKFLRTDQIRVQVCAYYPLDVAAALHNLTDGTATPVTAHMRSTVGMMRYHEVEMTGLAANKTYAEQQDGDTRVVNVALADASEGSPVEVSSIELF